MKTKTLFLVALFLALLVCAPDARASSIFNLDINNGCCGNGPYGTVQLFQNGPNEVDLQVNLDPGFYFDQFGQTGAFGFDLTVGGTPHVTVSQASINAGFSSNVPGSTSSHPEGMDGFGNFNFAITADASYNWLPIGQTLSFSVTDSSGISISNFLHTSTDGGSKATYFVADIYCPACSFPQIGFVGSDDVFHSGSDSVGSAVPEPATLFGSGLGLLMFGMLRFKRKLK
jgi:PEP-CTERM motif